MICVLKFIGLNLDFGQAGLVCRQGGLAFRQGSLDFRQEGSPDSSMSKKVKVVQRKAISEKKVFKWSDTLTSK